MSAVLSSPLEAPDALLRPLVRYHGGKWKLAPWLISHFPTHRVYVEAFGGGGSVLLRKKRAYAEVYNDLDHSIVNLFKVARDRGEELAALCELTPFARDEFHAAYDPTEDALENARRTLVRSFMGFGSAGVTGQSTGFRANTSRKWSTPAQNWRDYPDVLRLVIDRLRGVIIENRDAMTCMLSHDAPDVLHYVDPPYRLASRSFRPHAPNYRHEMTDQEHTSLAAGLAGLQGYVMVSGYRCDLYDSLYAGWTRHDRTSMADGARSRVESLWLSPNFPAGNQIRDAA